MGFRLAYLRLTLTNSKGPDQGREHFNNEFREYKAHLAETTLFILEVIHYQIQLLQTPCVISMHNMN